MKEAWPYLSQWSKRGVIAFLIYTVIVFGFGACLMRSAVAHVEWQQRARELQDRCCSCTQAELGRCGR